MRGVKGRVERCDMTNDYVKAFPCHITSKHDIRLFVLCDTTIEFIADAVY
jgi:hypothetical protein